MKKKMRQTIKASHNQAPLFFVFTCVKDGRKYISPLLKSMINQTSKNFIHYIYEDGSKEPLNEIIDEYKKHVSSLEKKYEIIYEKNPINMGLNMSTKHCIDMCNSPYFIWIDCDNWISNNFFEELEKTIKKNKKSIYIGTDRIDVDEKGNARRYLSSRRGVRLISKRKQDVNFLCYGYKYSFFAINKKYYDEINPEHFFVNDRFFFNDNQIITCCIISKYNFAFCKAATSYYLFRENSEGNACKDYIKDAQNLYFGVKKISRKFKWKYDEYLDILEHMHINELIAKHHFSDLQFNESYFCFKQNIKMAYKCKLPYRYKRYYFVYSSVWMILCKWRFLRKLILKNIFIH